MKRLLLQSHHSFCLTLQLHQTLIRSFTTLHTRYIAPIDIMEVDKHSFYPLLVDILTDISEAHFVAIDLELSGVPSKQSGGGGETGKPSLQQRYLETKEAAERYTILQLGLTCVQQDVSNGKYILKPYNFSLNPLIEQRGLDIERIFSFQSGAVEFLLKVGFDMSAPFHNGVPYLSRRETKEARDKHAKRMDKTAIADIQVKPTETESLKFLERVRGELQSWVTATDPKTAGYVNIASGAQIIGEDGDLHPPPDLTRFEKRLVHQLVRAEFPELVTLSKRGFIQVIRYDREREDRILEDRKRELEERISRQKGFRWIIEALHGGDITGIDLRECARNAATGEPIAYHQDEYKPQFHRAQSLLRNNPRRIVGHNCFLDLVYIYRTFIGKLPDTVEEFQHKLHKLWPNISDTKYMSTHNCGDINPASSLEQIADQLSQQEMPHIEIDPAHEKYKDVEAFHEAGYDSYLTAQIAIRLSAKLEQEGEYHAVDSEAKGDPDAVEDVTKGTNGLKLTGTTLDQHTYHAKSGTSPPSDVNGFMPSAQGARWKRKGDPTLAPASIEGPFTYDPKDLEHRWREPAVEKRMPGGMPPFSSDFWRTYGNKLRVFGTQEAVCVLDGGYRGSDDEDAEVGQGGVEISDL